MATDGTNVNGTAWERQPYAHLDSDPLKRASETIAGQIASAMSPGGSGAGVVPFKRPTSV
jgi:hypothetical protein